MFNGGLWRVVTQFGSSSAPREKADSSLPLRMTLVWNCRPESFGLAQDKLREGSAFSNESLPRTWKHRSVSECPVFSLLGWISRAPAFRVSHEQHEVKHF
jgi:hypothetical protein